VGTTRAITAVSLTALALLAGCGGDKTSTVTAPTATTASGSGTTTSTAPATTATTRGAAALKAALLTAADVPGSTVSTSTSTDSDFSGCFPGNPLGVKTDPNEVKGPDLELVDGTVQRQYGSSARGATTEQATAFVTTFATQAGSACVLQAFKSSITSDPTTSTLDPSGLTGSGKNAAVADGGAVLTVAGNLVGPDGPVPVSIDLLAFRKGSTVILLSVGAVQGPPVPNQSIELAQKIAGRLS
jgi:hypothetical protein